MPPEVDTNRVLEKLAVSPRVTVGGILILVGLVVSLAGLFHLAQVEQKITSRDADSAASRADTSFQGQATTEKTTTSHDLQLAVRPSILGTGIAVFAVGLFLVVFPSSNRPEGRAPSSVPTTPDIPSESDQDSSGVVYDSNTDHDAIQRLFHVADAHSLKNELSLLDRRHDWSEQTVSAFVAENRDYIGIYARTGLVKTSMTRPSSHFMIHAAASGPNPATHELPLLTWDASTGERLHHELVLNEKKCMIWKVSYASPKGPGSPISVRWMIRWPAAMNMYADGDALSWALFDHIPAVTRISLHVPTPPEIVVARTAVRQGTGFTYRNRPAVRAGETFPDTLRCEATIHRDDAAKGEVGFLLEYSSSPGSSVTPLRDVLKFRQARDADLPTVRAFDRDADGTRAASLEILQKRMNTWSDAITLGTVGGEVIGYLHAGALSESRTVLDSFESVASELLVGHVEPDLHYLSFLTVARPFRRLGLGSALLKHALTRARRDPKIRTVLLVAKPELEDWYRRFGFGRDRVVQNFVRGTDGILMRCDISRPNQG